MFRFVAMCFSAILTAVAAGPAHAQQAGGVAGRVVDRSGAPIADVAVHAEPAQRRTVTNEAGRFTLLGLPAGDQEISFELIGYTVQHDVVSIRPNQVLELEVTLSQRAVELEGIAVSVRESEISPWLASNGFASRRAQGRGIVHMTKQDLTFQSSRDLDELLRRVSGLRVRRLADGGSEILIDPSPRPDGRPCKVGVYLNGSSVEFGRFNWSGVRPTQRASRPLRFDDLLRLDEVDGIELYGPDESPVASENECGALLLWSTDLRRSLDEPLVGAVHGSVLREGSGEAVVGARVVLDPMTLSAVTAGDGSFAIPDVAPGVYEATVEVEGTSAWTTSVHVKAFGITELRVLISTRAHSGTNSS